MHDYYRLWRVLATIMRLIAFRVAILIMSALSLEPVTFACHMLNCYSLWQGVPDHNCRMRCAHDCAPRAQVLSSSWFFLRIISLL